MNLGITRFYGRWLWSFNRDLLLPYPDLRRRITESLAGISQRFRVHVFVEEDEMQKIVPIESLVRSRRHVPRLGPRDFIKHSLHVVESFGAGRKRQIPSRIVRNARGIIERIAVLHNRGAAEQMPQHPELLEEGDVSYLPAHRIDDREPGPNQLLVGEVRHQFKGPLPRLDEPFHEN